MRLNFMPRLHPRLIYFPHEGSSSSAHLVGLKKRCTNWDLLEENSALRDCTKIMEDVLSSTKGYGLAAPQINVQKRMFLIYTFADGPDASPKFHHFVNPKIIYRSMRKQLIWEECLSFKE